MQPRSKYNYQYCLALNAKQVCIYLFFFFLAQVEFILSFIEYFLLQWLINDFNIEG